MWAGLNLHLLPLQGCECGRPGCARPRLASRGRSPSAQSHQLLTRPAGAGGWEVGQGGFLPVSVAGGRVPAGGLVS